MWIAGLIVCLGWILSLCFHEFAHAIVAYWGGDTSVKDKGYLTFNPIKYTEPGFSLIMPLVFILIGGLGLPGGAVYINDNLLRNRRWSSLVSAAGPFASLLFALFLMIPFWVFNFDLNSPLSYLDYYGDSTFLYIVFPIYIVFPSLAFLIYLEMFAVVFNLLPIPPLDGYGILQPWLPEKINQTLRKYSNYTYYFIFGLFIFSPQLSSIFFGGIRKICNLLGVSSQTISLGRDFFYQPINKGIAICIIILVAYLLRLNENTWHNKGNDLAYKEQDEQALIAYDKAIKINPKHADSWLNKGHTLWKLERNAEAIECLQKAIEINPKLYKSFLYMGNIYFNAQDYEKAVDYYKKTISIDQDSSEAWVYLTWSLLQLSKDEEANISLEKIIAKVDNLYKAKQYQTAIELCQETIRVFPKHAKLWSYLDKSIKELKKSKGEKYILDNIMTLDFKLKKVAYLFKSEQYQNVINFCNEIIEEHPKNTNILYYLAISLDKLEKYAEAQDIFEQIISFDPQNTLVLSGQAGHYYVQQDYTRAVNNFQKITAIEPDNDTAWYNMACCYSLQQDAQKAIAALEQAITISPQSSRELAQKDQDFTFIQNAQEFQDLVYGIETKPN